jgi:hypothetical protein
LNKKIKELKFQKIFYLKKGEKILKSKIKKRIKFFENILEEKLKINNRGFLLKFHLIPLKYVKLK